MSYSLSFSTINHRSNNEDCCLAFDITTHGSGEQKISVLLLADGMGGHKHGEEYSRIGIETMASLLTRELLVNAIIPSSHTGNLGLCEDFLHRVLVETNEVLKETMYNNGWDTGGTTIAAVIIAESNYYYISLGDSLIYHWSAKKGKLQQISDNHSVTGILLKRGVITPEEAQTHHQRHHLGYFMGMDKIPLLEEIENAGRGTLMENDVILLCSDGICGDINHSELQNIFNLNEEDLNKLTQELIVVPRLKGVEDNQTMILYKNTKSSLTNENKVFLSSFNEKYIKDIIQKRVSNESFE